MRKLPFFFYGGILIWLCNRFVWSPEFEKYAGDVRIVEGEIVGITCHYRKQRADYVIDLADKQRVFARAYRQRCNYSILNEVIGNQLRASFAGWHLMELFIGDVQVYHFKEFRRMHNITNVFWILTILILASLWFIHYRRNAIENSKNIS